MIGIWCFYFYKYYTRYYISFSEEIKMVRMKAFLTQPLFAEEIHVSFSTINRWENGKGKPNLTAMKAIKSFCEVHDIPCENLETEWINSQSKLK
ncbi:MAG: helix-turn-helix domain-containing protein [Clostridioides difficile]